MSRFGTTAVWLPAAILWLFISGIPAYADTAADQQRIRELQAQIDELERQAEQRRAIIAITRDQGDSLKKELAILKNQIGAVQAKIAATGARISKTQLEISGVQNEIGEKHVEIGRKRATIGRMVLFLDQKDREDSVANLFKYARLSEFVSQLHDMANVQDRILDVIADIKETRVALERDQVKLEGKLEELENLNEESAQRRRQLSGVKIEKDRLLLATKGQEAEYQKQLTDIEQRKVEFFREMRELELKIVSGGLYVVRITADSVPKAGTKLFQWPEDDYRITQGYGCTRYARCGRTSAPYGGAPHNGVDITAGFGVPVKAIGGGRIVASGMNGGWGNWVAIQHPNNMVSVYGHLSSFSALNVGSQVAVGQVIGYEGNTGNVTGSHLHLSLYRDFFTYIRDKDGQLYFNYFEGSLNPLDYM